MFGTDYVLGGPLCLTSLRASRKVLSFGRARSSEVDAKAGPRVAVTVIFTTAVVQVVVMGECVCGVGGEPEINILWCG